MGGAGRPRSKKVYATVLKEHRNISKDKPAFAQWEARMFYNAYYRSLGAALAGEPGQGGNPAAISRNFRVGPAVCILYYC
jgi:hypothetical protein